MKYNSEKFNFKNGEVNNSSFLPPEVFQRPEITAFLLTEDGKSLKTTLAEILSM